MESIEFQRFDLSDWVIHFIHRRNPENDAREWFEDFQYIPIGFNKNLNAIYYDWDYTDSLESPLEPDAYPYSVLKKILFDGYIRAGWSYRKGKPSIYGPHPAVCFTEMPLYAYFSYIKKRNNENFISPYAIAVRKRELYKAGARPVIYGITGEHRDNFPENGEYKYLGPRILDSSCEIGLKEQYRYVYTNLYLTRHIDWMHEREWRWPYRVELNLEEEEFQSGMPFSDVEPGLPIWLGREDEKFSQILVVVPSTEEANNFVNELKSYYDSGSNNYDFPFSKKSLENTYVLALEELDDIVEITHTIRIEDLPFKTLPKIKAIVPSNETLERVSKAMEQAKAYAEEITKNVLNNIERSESGHIKDVFGFANACTYDAHSEITQALISLDFAESLGNLGYIIDVEKSVNTEGVLCIEEAFASALAEKLTELLEQPFYTHTKWD